MLTSQDVTEMMKRHECDGEPCATCILFIEVQRLLKIELHWKRGLEDMPTVDGETHADPFELAKMRGLAIAEQAAILAMYRTERLALMPVEQLRDRETGALEEMGVECFCGEHE